MHTLHGFWLKIKSFLPTLRERDDVFIGILIIFVGLLSFGLGRLSMLGEGIGVIEVRNIGVADAVVPLTASAVLSHNKYVASRNGGKYHAPWCSGAQRIKESNKVWFSSKEEAEKAGYSPAANCKGL